MRWRSTSPRDRPVPSVVMHGAAATQPKWASEHFWRWYVHLAIDRCSNKDAGRRGHKTNPLQPFWLTRMEPAGFEKIARYLASTACRCGHGWPSARVDAAAAAASGAPALLRSGAHKRKAGRLAAAAKVVARRREKFRAAVRAKYRKDPNHKRAAAKAAHAAAPDEKRALARAAYAAAPDNKRALARAASEVAFDAA